MDLVSFLESQKKNSVSSKKSISCPLIFVGQEYSVNFLTHFFESFFSQEENKKILFFPSSSSLSPSSFTDSQDQFPLILLEEECDEKSVGPLFEFPVFKFKETQKIVLEKRKGNLLWPENFNKTKLPHSVERQETTIVALRKNKENGEGWELEGGCGKIFKAPLLGWANSIRSFLHLVDKKTLNKEILEFLLAKKESLYLKAKFLIPLEAFSSLLIEQTEFFVSVEEAIFYIETKRRVVFAQALLVGNEENMGELQVEVTKKMRIIKKTIQKIFGNNKKLKSCKPASIKVESNIYSFSEEEIKNFFSSSSVLFSSFSKECIDLIKNLNHNLN